MKIIKCEQLSPEWWQARKGIPTASNFGRIITPKTGKLAAAADDYICELIADQYRIDPEERYQNAAMRHGTETEPEARRWYEMEYGVNVEQVGFVTMDDGRFGCSPDGLIDGQRGLLQIKCPNAKTQIRYLLDDCLPDEYKTQVHGELIVTEYEWSDFLSYCPGLPKLVVRVTQDSFTRNMRPVLDDFHGRYRDALTKVKGMR